jgi:hypothetical protein
VASPPASGRLFDIFDDHCDIGRPRMAGSASYDAERRVYLISAAGVNMWDVRDEFHFIWTRVQGDFRLSGRVEFLGPQKEPHRKAGCIVRAGLEDNAPYADAALHGDGLTSLQYRRTAGAITEQVVSPLRGATAFDFERSGLSWIMRAGVVEGPMAVSTLTGVDLGTEFYLGLFLCSHNADILERAAFHDVQLER